ncbi:NUDIX hydrolase [Salana multivorans]
MAPPTVHVTAVVLTDRAGRLLLVRKRGTTAFMQPGGKPEPGEGALEAGLREVHEELGLALAASRLTPLGQYQEVAANEAGHVVVADAFGVAIDDAESAAVRPAAEIAEAVWVTREEAGGLPLAPLTRTHFLPLVP